MAETIPGGASQDSSGNWIDANGKPLADEQIAQAKRLIAQRAAALAAQERQALETQARNDPIARSLTAALAPQQPAPAPRAVRGAREKDSDE